MSDESLKEGEEELELLDYQTRHGVPVVNAKRPTDEVQRLEAVVDSQQASLVPLGLLDYDVPELAGFTVRPVYRIKHGTDEMPGEFDGRFIGEEFHSWPHPLLLLPAACVTRRQK